MADELRGKLIISVMVMMPPLADKWKATNNRPERLTVELGAYPNVSEAEAIQIAECFKKNNPDMANYWAIVWNGPRVL